MTNQLHSLRFDERGLIPAIVQSAENRQVLMLAYMTQEALQRTLETGETFFWSRSRQCLWHKGETSGNTQSVVDIRFDCDADAVLVLVRPSGPACHTGESTCFHNSLQGRETEQPGRPDPTEGTADILSRIASVVAARKRHPQEGSYTCRLLEEGREGILKKIGEEAFEVALASVSEQRSQVIHETADLAYHILVLLGYEGIELREIRAELERRYSP